VIKETEGMKPLNKLLLLSVITLLTAPAVEVQAGGPGFDKDVNNWSNQNDDDRRSRDDDDDRHKRDDDDRYKHDDDDDNNEIPLDGGLSFLALAGTAFGI